MQGSHQCCCLLQERYEKHHQCVFDVDALPAAVTLSSRYIPDRYLPDKAIDVMDEAASRVRLQAYETRRAAAWPMGRHDIAEWEILVQVLDAKDEAVQVCCLHHKSAPFFNLPSMPALNSLSLFHAVKCSCLARIW